jgi:branched-chain amino acid aminotransferase
VYQDREHPVGSGAVGPVTTQLRSQLVAIQRGEREDRHGWVTRV